MNVAKQVTNGAVPMGAVVASSEIYHTFMNQALPEHAVEFSHGYTYSAHPVACAAALATLDILARENEALISQSAELAPHFETCAARPARLSAGRGHPQLRAGRRHSAGTP